MIAQQQYMQSSTHIFHHHSLLPHVSHVKGHTSRAGGSLSSNHLFLLQIVFLFCFLWFRSHRHVLSLGVIPSFFNFQKNLIDLFSSVHYIEGTDDDGAGVVMEGTGDIDGVDTNKFGKSAFMSSGRLKNIISSNTPEYGSKSG